MTSRSTALLVAAVLALTACSGGDGTTGDQPASSSATSSGPAPSPSSSSPTATLTGAPSALATAVARHYGASSITGSATTGRWRGDEVAVVTGTGTQEGDVTLAVRPRGRQGWRVVGGWWPSLGAKGKAQVGGRTHVLLIGSDARPGERVGRSRADALQLVGVDGSGGAGLMGFARDLWVPIPGHGSGKINSAMVYGGPEVQTQVVDSLTGIEAEGYVLTGFDGFRAMVDELGGLSFRAPFSMDSGLTGGQIAKGARRLSGQQALAWARERKTLPGGDFDRSRNQGLLLAAAALQARLAGPSVLPTALTIIDKHTESDLSGEQMLLLAAAFYQVSPTKVGHAVAQGPTGMTAGQSVVRLDEASRAAFSDFRDGRLSR